MYGITNPVIRECAWRQCQEVSTVEFHEDMIFAGRSGHPVHTWTGETRGGDPLVVVWVAGKRAGQVFSAYEITEGKVKLSQHDIMRAMVALNEQYEMTTGHDAYLHSASVDGHAVFHFIGGVVTDTPEGALRHMEELMGQLAEEFAENG